VGDAIKAAGAAAAAVAGAVNETAIVESMKAAERKLPNPLLPDFWAVLLLFAIIIANGLVWFVQRWSLYIKSRVQYKDTPSLEPGSFAYVTPHPHQGAAEIVPMQEQVIDGKRHIFFMFQRQKYQVRDMRLPNISLSLSLNLSRSFALPFFSLDTLKHIFHRRRPPSITAHHAPAMRGEDSLSRAK